jgi:rfaE bifunctional protein nucleotidyltransferase chain/domain
LGRVISPNELITRRAEWKRDGKRVVFVSGSFDFLHPGHIRLLEQAHAHGDILVVGVESDRNAHSASVPAGDCVRRPINPAAERTEIVAALAAVDYAFENDPKSSSDVIAWLNPNVIVEGGNPAPASSRAAGQNARAAATNKLVRIPLELGHSTARLIERIKNISA